MAESKGYNGGSRVPLRAPWPPPWLKVFDPATAPQPVPQGDRVAEREPGERPPLPPPPTPTPTLNPCPKCGAPLDRRCACWRCGTRPCVGCGRDTGSPFIARCVPCGQRFNGNRGGWAEG
jgi:hypothetical protein